MSTVIDVSSKLGEYMLKGWVLTDKICKTCSKVPLMRSPTDSAIFYCANCDSQPRPSDATGSSSASSIDSASHISRTSTPLTEVSSTLSSPTFEPPVDTEEIMRRRQQSDMASTEIGKRLLKGWAMLADECPNEHCYGIPLVRPPKSGADKDTRKECVVCHNAYVDQIDSTGIERLVVVSAPSTSQAPPLPAEHLNPASPVASPSSARKGKAVQRVEEHADARGPTMFVPQRVDNTPNNSLHGTITPRMTQANDLSSDVANAADALQYSLRRLTDRLTSVSSGGVTDVEIISHTAEAIGKVSQALVQVQHLQKTNGA